jgi:hypothetical protein
MARLALLLLILMSGFAEAEDRAALAARICEAAENQSKVNGIDPSFFVRLLWRESLFDPNVVSDKGAQGIAQFMPGTAAMRGLSNPFDPMAAVAASATYLAELKKTFGNLGLAAAAYNSGEARTQDWLSAKGSIPAETRDYVNFITGHGIEDWKSPSADLSIPSIGAKPLFTDNCVALAMQKTALDGAHIDSAPRSPWGAVIAVNFSEQRAVAQFRRLRLRFPNELAGREPMISRKRNLSRGRTMMTWVMLGEQTVQAAQQTCSKLNVADAPCIVRKN